MSYPPAHRFHHGRARSAISASNRSARPDNASIPFSVLARSAARSAESSTDRASAASALASPRASRTPPSGPRVRSIDAGFKQIVDLTARPKTVRAAVHHHPVPAS